MLKTARVTDDKTEIPAVVVVHDKRMKDIWCLATSRDDIDAAGVVALYGRRFTIEETFRDTKDPSSSPGPLSPSPSARWPLDRHTPATAGGKGSSGELGDGSTLERSAFRWSCAGELVSPT